MAPRGNGIKFRHDLILAKRLWAGRIDKEKLHSLRHLCQRHGLSIAAGDLQLLDNRWYVTHAGLLRLAQRRHCSGITARLITEFCDRSLSRWVFQAVVYKRPNSKGFVGYGDADPSNVSSLVQGAELRIAETRAVNRALRKAYGIGICSVEELGSLGSSTLATPKPEQFIGSQPVNGSNNGQPRLRDKLCLLIRQYDLDATLVKAYAADFCGTETLRGASRELVESFISHLENLAREDRESLICKLNSYSRPAEVRT